MGQRRSLITLGVADTARAFYEALGRSGGGYSGVFSDPDGHPWEAAQNPGWQLTDDGATLLRPLQ